MGDHKIKNIFPRYFTSCNLGILFVICLTQVRNIHAGSFYQRGLPDTRISNNADISFSPITPLHVRELLSNHRIGSLRNGNRVIPGSKLDVLFVDLNDIDKSETRRPIVPSRGGRIVSNYQSPRFNSVQQQRSKPRQNFRQQSYARNLQLPQNENFLQIERVPVSEIQEILKLLPNIENQIEKLNRQERTRYVTSSSNRNNNNYGSSSGNRQRTINRQPLITNRELRKRTNANLMRNNNGVRNSIRTQETVVYN